jgi:AraC-like DNA-binding protein
MDYTPHDLFVGALENATTCSPNNDEQQIWPKFMLMVLLQGAQRFVIDGVPFRVDARSGNDGAPVAFMLNVARQSTLRFINDNDVPLRKVMISAPLPWLERLFETQKGIHGSTLREFFSQHLAHFSFEPGQHILHLAQKIINPPPVLQGDLRSLYLQAQALDIMWQSCLTMVSEREGHQPSATLMSLRHCERVKDFILANLHRDLSIDLIAREAGLSTSTVQRRFKEHFGIPIFDFIRQERLEAARAALASNGIPVSHAAHMAGYNNISSFTTAFRKAYGITPRQVRI